MLGINVQLSDFSRFFAYNKEKEIETKRQKEMARWLNLFNRLPDDIRREELARLEDLAVLFSK